MSHIKKTDKTVKKHKTVTLTCYALQKTSSHSFRGGLIPPEINGDIHLKIWHENQPIDGERTTERFTGEPQLNTTRTSEAYESLGKFFLCLAELNTDICPDYHTHNELVSEDGKSKLHFSFRRSETKD